MKNVARCIILLFGVMLFAVGIYILFVISDSHTGIMGGVSRANTDIAFGADFYTTSAQYTGLAANASSDVFDILQLGIGCFFAFLGGTTCCIVILTWSNGGGRGQREDKDVTKLQRQRSVVTSSQHNDDYDYE